MICRRVFVLSVNFNRIRSAMSVFSNPKRSSQSVHTHTRRRRRTDQSFPLAAPSSFDTDLEFRSAARWSTRPSSSYWTSVYIALDCQRRLTSPHGSNGAHVDSHRAYQPAPFGLSRRAIQRTDTDVSPWRERTCAVATSRIARVPTGSDRQRRSSRSTCPYRELR